MPTIEQRLNTIERLLRDVLRKVPEDEPRYLPEEEVCKRYGLSRSRLKQYRLGCTKNGKRYEPAIHNWTKQNGRHIEYELAELERVFKRK